VNKTLKKILAPIASLRLTVALFAAAIILIFVGTVAQKYDGNWTVVDRYFRSLWLMMPIGFKGLKVPFPGGYTLSILMLVNLIAAHTVRFKFTWKRAGILLTHAGLILLLTGELVTGLFAVEWQMPIDEGKSANYAIDIRESELAIVDPSPENHDNVVVVPQSILLAHLGKSKDTPGQTISDPLLPFDIQILRWLPNSALAGVGMANQEMKLNNPATEGLGLMAIAVEQPHATGVQGGEMDAPSAYIQLSRDGEILGTWMVSLHTEVLGDPRQPVTIDGKTYFIEMRYRRDYKPYTMHLIDFKHDKFVGTEKARNFSSEIRLVDPTQNTDRKVLIYMNHPLRYRGETFYQSGYYGETRTILQVVRNPGWLMPYAACALVSLGLFIHFGVMLRKFVSRTRP
jgi:ResB-like family protein